MSLRARAFSYPDGAWAVGDMGSFATELLFGVVFPLVAMTLVP